MTIQVFKSFLTCVVGLTGAATGMPDVAWSQVQSAGFRVAQAVSTNGGGTPNGTVQQTGSTVIVSEAKTWVAASLPPDQIESLLQGQRLFDVNQEVVGRIHGVQSADGGGLLAQVMLQGFLGSGDKAVLIPLKDITVSVRPDHSIEIVRTAHNLNDLITRPAAAFQ